MLCTRLRLAPWWPLPVGTPCQLQDLPLNQLQLCRLLVMMAFHFLMLPLVQGPTLAVPLGPAYTTPGEPPLIAAVLVPPPAGAPTSGEEAAFSPAEAPVESAVAATEAPSAATAPAPAPAATEVSTAPVAAAAPAEAPAQATAGSMAPSIAPSGSEAASSAQAASAAPAPAPGVSVLPILSTPAGTTSGYFVPAPGGAPASAPLAYASQAAGSTPGVAPASAPAGEVHSCPHCSLAG